MFESVIDEVDQRRKEITVYAAGETDVSDRFATRNVAFSHRTIGPEAPGPFLAIYEDGDFCGAIGLDELDWLVEPPVVRPGARADLSAGYRALFELLDGALFTTLDRRQLLAASREIEDRARRVGHGTLRVSFQRLSVFDTQADLYRDLAAETALDIHVYGEPDWTPPEVPGVTFHGADEVTRFWCLAFDGGGDPQQTCALLARSHDDRYTGFWTYDPTLVSEMQTDLEEVTE